MKKTVHIVIHGCRFTSEVVSEDVAEEVKTQLCSKDIECYTRFVALTADTRVRTLQPNPGVYNWVPERNNCQWGVEGKILKCHNSHGLCYEVEHSGTTAYYDPTEIEEVES